MEAYRPVCEMGWKLIIQNSKLTEHLTYTKDIQCGLCWWLFCQGVHSPGTRVESVWEAPEVLKTPGKSSFL